MFLEDHHEVSGFILIKMKKAFELLLKDSLERTFWREHHVLYPNRSLGYIDVCICQNPWNGTLNTCTFHYIFKRQKRKKKEL